jgi:Tannase and feruloyl esterase
MILFHGYSDGFINPFRTIRFYQDWAKLRGGYEALGKNARLFMVPGMYHCNRGRGRTSSTRWAPSSSGSSTAARRSR